MFTKSFCKREFRTNSSAYSLYWSWSRISWRICAEIDFLKKLCKRFLWNELGPLDYSSESSPGLRSSEPSTLKLMQTQSSCLRNSKCITSCNKLVALPKQLRYNSLVVSLFDLQTLGEGGGQGSWPILPPPEVPPPRPIPAPPPLFHTLNPKSMIPVKLIGFVFRRGCNVYRIGTFRLLVRVLARIEVIVSHTIWSRQYDETRSQFPWRLVQIRQLLEWTWSVNPSEDWDLQTPEGGRAFYYGRGTPVRRGFGVHRIQTFRFPVRVLARIEVIIIRPAGNTSDHQNTETVTLYEWPLHRYPTCRKKNLSITRPACHRRRPPAGVVVLLGSRSFSHTAHSQKGDGGANTPVSGEREAPFSIYIWPSEYRDRYAVWTGVERMTSIWYPEVPIMFPTRPPCEPPQHYLTHCIN